MRRRDFVAWGATVAAGHSLWSRWATAQTPADRPSDQGPAIDIPGFGRVSLDPADYDAEKIAAQFRQNFPQGIQGLREHFGGAIEAISSRDPQQMAALAQPLIQQAARVASLPLIGSGLEDSLMSPAEPEVIQRGSGTPVYYVNGIFTPLETAQNEARELAKQLSGRPVSLFYNHGTPPRVSQELAGKDLEEAYRDRVWPVYLTGLLTGKSLGAGLRTALGGGSPLQHNPTTRQLAHLLVHTARQNPSQPIGLVGYSQGSMIVRNALFTLALLQQQEFAEQRVAFVAPGLPINNNEVWPVPAKFTPIVDPRDPVPAYFGLQGDAPRPADAAIQHHGWFDDGYASRIKPEMLEI